MIRIIITDTAFRAISGRDPTANDAQSGAGRYGAPPAGHTAVWLLPAVIESLRAAKRPGETYSDVILRL